MTTRRTNPRKPRPPGPSARERRAICCTDLEWEEARELAHRQGTPIARLLVEAALDPPAHLLADDEEVDGGDMHDELPDQSHEQPLALTPDEQRELHEAITTLATAADNAMLPAAPFGMNMQDGVRFLLAKVMDDLVTSGRPDRIHDLSGLIFDDLERREQVRRWVMRRSSQVN
jgi:hypothetical protein